MKCKKCGMDYPSRYYFKYDSVCINCFKKQPGLSSSDVESVNLSNEKANFYSVDGHQLQCQICGHDQFWYRKTLMNTPGVTFLGMEWANKQAENYICNNCGYIMWFMRE